MIDSPCRNACQLDPTGVICLGCLRTLEEIAGWRTMTEQQQQRLIDSLKTRQAPCPQAAP